MSSFRYFKLSLPVFQTFYVLYYLASAGGHKEVVKLLIEAGANLFEENKVFLLRK